jgi:ribosomal protein L15
MKELKAYVEQKNQWAAIFKGAQLDLSSAADRQKIADRIDADLSPENLTCDGELPRSQVQAKYRQLTKAAEQLISIDPSVKFYEFSA